MIYRGIHMDEIKRASITSFRREADKKPNILKSWNRRDVAINIQCHNLRKYRLKITTTPKWILISLESLTM